MQAAPHQCSLLFRCAYCTATVVLTGMPPMEPVMVSELVPLGTVMLSVAEEVPLAITALAGTTPGGVLARLTVVSCMAFLTRLSVTVAGPPAVAGLGRTVMAFRASSTQAMFCSCLGGVGGVAQG